MLNPYTYVMPPTTVTSSTSLSYGPQPSGSFTSNGMIINLLYEDENEDNMFLFNMLYEDRGDMSKIFCEVDDLIYNQSHNRICTPVPPNNVGCDSGVDLEGHYPSYDPVGATDAIVPLPLAELSDNAALYQQGGPDGYVS